MRHIKYSTILLVLTVIFSSCSNNQDDPFTIEFLVLDDESGLPLEGAVVQQLEDGNTVLTESDGIAVFSDHDLKSTPVLSIQDSTAYAFSVSHPHFRTRELNVGTGEASVSLMRDSTGQYTYYQPVQLDDGLVVSDLKRTGFDLDRIQNLMEKIAEPAYQEIHSLLIYKDDHLVLEEYYFGNNDTIQFENNIRRDRTPEPIRWSRNDPHYVASVNKALTSTLAGIALDKHGLESEALLKDYLPDYSAHFENDDHKSALSYHHALNMILGFQWNEWGSNDLSLLWKSDDFAEFLLSRPNNGPGSRWIYNSASSNVVLKSLENMVQEPIRDWAHEHFYEPLGITHFNWQYQPDGYPEGAARMYLRPRDMIKIGATYLNDGVWNGEQIIPKEWVDKVSEVTVNTSSGDYSYSFWHRELDGVRYISADGDGGNYINIFPDQNMVIVITQGNYLQWPLYVQQADDMMENYIIPAVK